MKSFGRPFLISSAIVLGISFLFYFVLFSKSIHLGEDRMAIDGSSAIIRALFVTSGYIIAFRFVGWLREHPEKQRLAANAFMAVLIVLIGVRVMQCLLVPTTVLDSPLMPEYVVTFVRRPILVEIVGLVVTLVLGWSYRRSGTFVRCTISGIVGIGFDLMFSSLWSFFSIFFR